MQEDDGIIIPQNDFYSISWETDFKVFPTNCESKKTSDDYSADSDQQDTIITDLDLRSTRLQTNTGAVDTEPLACKEDSTDLRSTLRQTNTDTADSKPLARQLNDEGSQFGRRQQDTDSENDEITSQTH